MCDSLRIYITNLVARINQPSSPLRGIQNYQSWCLFIVQTSDRDSFNIQNDQRACFPCTTSYKTLLYREFTFRRDCTVRSICHCVEIRVIMGFEQRLSKTLILIQFPKSPVWSATSEFSEFCQAPNLQCGLAGVWINSTRRITLQHKRIIYLKNQAHLVGRGLGIILVPHFDSKTQESFTLFIHAAFWVLLHAVLVRLKTTGKAIRKGFQKQSRQDI